MPKLKVNSRIILITIILSILFAGFFNYFYPFTDITEALAVIVILSIVLGNWVDSFLALCFYKHKRKTKHEDDKNSKPDKEEENDNT